MSYEIRPGREKYKGKKVFADSLDNKELEFFQAFQPTLETAQTLTIHSRYVWLINQYLASRKEPIFLPEPEVYSPDIVDRLPQCPHFPADQSRILGKWLRSEKEEILSKFLRRSSPSIEFLLMNATEREEKIHQHVHAIFRDPGNFFLHSGGFSLGWYSTHITLDSAVVWPRDPGNMNQQKTFERLEKEAES